MNMNFLERFFAVTNTSVYEVICVDNKAKVIKKMLRGESSIPIGGELTGGPMVSVGKQLIMFTPEGDKTQITDIKVDSRGGNTSLVVALFLKEKDAVDCFNAGDGVGCDKRWLNQTKGVLNLIANNHPAFSVSKSPSFSLVPVYN
jgi:hypothetical protein